MAFVPPLRNLIHDLHPDVGLAQETTLGRFIRQLTARHRTFAFASMALAVLGVLLVVLGSVSLFVSMVKDSLREIAIRMALGASHMRLTGRIVAQGLMLTLAGVVLGAGGAFFISRRIADQLYKTEAGDPLTFVTVSSLILLIGVLAVYWSATLGTRTDPAKCLRGD